MKSFLGKRDYEKDNNVQNSWLGPTWLIGCSLSASAIEMGIQTPKKKKRMIAHHPLSLKMELGIRRTPKKERKLELSGSVTVVLVLRD